MFDLPQGRIYGVVHDVSRQFLSRISTLVRYLQIGLHVTTSVIEISVRYSFTFWAPTMHEVSPI